jgi:signal transduction histidine kinase
MVRAMTGLLVLTFIPAAAAILFWLRVREQRRTIDLLRRQIDERDGNTRNEADHNARLFGTVAHELRSPIAAILGYEELLAEGVFGDLDPRAAEPLGRIRSSARQLLTLTDGMHELSGHHSGSLDLEEVDHARALRAAYHRASAEADARRVRLEPPRGTDRALLGTGEPRTVDAILDAVCGAALKSSADRAVTPSIEADDALVQYRFDGTGLDPERIRADPLATGAGLRIAIAEHMARRLGGTVRLHSQADSTTIEIALPRAVERRSD